MRALGMLSLAMLFGGCDSEQTVANTKQMAEDVSEASRRAADATVEGTNKTIDGGRRAVDATVEGTNKTIDGGRRAVDAATERANTEVERASALYDKITDTGELSRSATAWIEARAKEQGGAVEQIIVKGKQVAPVALQIGGVLNQAVARDTSIEPIYQKIDDEAASRDLDAAIGDMPRVEVIEGLTVGIRQLDTLQTDQVSKERAYLVTWRHDDHLVGFVYRSSRTIDIDRLLEELPPLIRATQTVLRTPG